MANLRELRSRIKSVNSTKKITKAQEMIATSRITKAQARVAAAQPYASEITAVLQDLASASSLRHPMLNEREDPKRAAILVVTSDRGMCGGYNHNVIKEANELAVLLKSQGKEVALYLFGSKAVGYYTFRDIDYVGAWTGFSQQPSFDDVKNVCQHLSDLFLASTENEIAAIGGIGDGHGAVRGVDEVHICYTKFESMLTQTPRARRVVPIETVVEEEQIESGEYVTDSDTPGEHKPEVSFEPDPDTLLTNLLPRYLSTRIFASVLESAASESAARRTAMKAATDNANELVNDLSRVANQARQAQITQEISEIVGGASALAASAGSD